MLACGILVTYPRSISIYAYKWMHLYSLDKNLVWGKIRRRSDRFWNRIVKDTEKTSKLASFRDRRRVDTNSIRNKENTSIEKWYRVTERPQSLWIGLSRNTGQQTSKAPASLPSKKPSDPLGDTEGQAVGDTSNRRWLSSPGRYWRHANSVQADTSRFLLERAWQKSRQTEQKTSEKP